MAINFGAEYKRFEKEMAKRHELYAQLGMSQEQIDALDEFDKEEFLSDNTYKRHVQSLSIDEDSGNPEDLHPLFKKFGDVLSVELKVTFRDKYAWLDEISSPELIGNFSLLRQRISNCWTLTSSERRPRLNLRKQTGFHRRTSQKSSIA